MRFETRANSRLFAELARSLTRAGIAVRFRAHGRSMYPAIADGELVQVEAPEADPQRGDVVMTECDSGIRVHRATQAGTAIRTQGDCCFEEDGANSQLIGAVKIVDNGGLRSVGPQRLGSKLRRWVACLRGRF